MCLWKIAGGLKSFLIVGKVHIIGVQKLDLKDCLAVRSGLVSWQSMSFLNLHPSWTGKLTLF